MRIYKSISANYVFIEKRLFQVGNALILRWLNKQFFSRIYVKSFFCPADASEMEAEERKEEGTPSGETLEAAFGKLDQMLETLESSDVSLEDSFRLYKEGMELLNECSQKIDRVEKKMLQMNEDGTFREF